MAMDGAEMESQLPNDKYKLVLITFMLNGLVARMPHNMFITAKSYFIDFKLGESNTSEKSDYATTFLTYVGSAGYISTLVSSCLNAFVNVRVRGCNLTTRIIWSIIVEIIVFIVTILLAVVDSSKWPGAFCWTTVLSVVVINVASGIHQNTFQVIAAKLPSKYMRAVLLGSNVSGVFTTAIQKVSSTFAQSRLEAVVYYFATAIIVLILCFGTNWALPLNRFYRYHEKRNAEANQGRQTPFFCGV